MLLAKKWTDKVFEVQRPSDRIILLKLIIGKTVYNLVNVYAPQQGRPEDRFYDQLNAVIAKIPLSEVLIPGGDWNGHVGRAADGFEEVHSGFGYGERNAEGGRLLDFAVAHDLVIGNTLSKKGNSHLITYASGDHETHVDYLFRRGLRKYIRDVKVILGEECLTQHRLLVCIFKIAAVPRVKRKFTPCLRTWKNRDPACAAEFEAKFEKCFSGQVVNSATQSSEEIWDHLKSTLNSAAEEVCGYSKNHQWKRETWWSDMKVDEAVKEKRRCFKVWSRFKKQIVYGDARKAVYGTTKKHAKRVIWLAKQDTAKTEYANVDPKGPEIHHMAKQMRRQNQDICGEMPVRNNQGELCLDDSERMKAWIEHYKGLLNVEFPVDEGALPDALPVEGPTPPITDEMVTKALAKKKLDKSSGPSGIIVEMLKTTGSKYIDFLRQPIKSFVKHGKIPEDWEISFILNLYKGKGDALNSHGENCGWDDPGGDSHWWNAIRLCPWTKYNRCYIHHSGAPGEIPVQERSQWQEPDSVLCFCWSGESIWPCPRKVLWWVMRKVGVEEWIVRLVQAMYNNARSWVRVGSEYSEEFEVGVGVHQGSVLSPLLFIIVLEAYLEILGWGRPGSCSLQMISWSLLLLSRNALNVPRRGRRDWNPRVFM